MSHTSILDQIEAVPRRMQRPAWVNTFVMQAPETPEPPEVCAPADIAPHVHEAHAAAMRRCQETMPQDAPSHDAPSHDGSALEAENAKLRHALSMIATRAAMPVTVERSWSRLLAQVQQIASDALNN
jgi:hypothetical protein